MTPAEAEAQEARLRAALQVNPDSALAHAQLGELLMSQDRPAEALESLAEAVRREPMDAEFRISLARANLALGEYVEAVAHVEWASELEPRNAAVWLGLGEALLGQQRMAEAATALERAVALSPEDGRAASLLELARAAAPGAEQASGGGSWVARALTWFFTAILTIAGLGLILPVAASLVVLVVFLPAALIQRRRNRRTSAS